MISKMHTKGKGGFTLVEIMIVVAIIALLAAIAVPSFLRARVRSQATTVLNELRLVDAAKDQYLIENNIVASTATPTGDAIAPYLKAGSTLYVNPDAAGTGTDVDSSVDAVTIVLENAVTLPSVTGDFDTDVVPDDFWSPYGKN